MTEDNFKICGFCGTQFQSRKKNQKYCDNICCRGATNKRIMQRYYENKARLAGVKRLCSNCSKQLSRYNSSNICGSCEILLKDHNHSKIREMLDVINSKISKTKSK
ncbi:MAG: hypothetical protein EB127_08955 [Alphaproteobacteria bacterium]|nr:hypothetical protein [Alphaproteobacteria bacterium]